MTMSESDEQKDAFSDMYDEQEDAFSDMYDEQEDAFNDMYDEQEYALIFSDKKAVMNEIEDELSKIEGLDKLKLQLRKWLKGMLMDDRRRALGLDIGPRRLPQFAFLGNPGTGKTMIARMVGKLLHMVGMLPKDKVIEVQRTDLVGKYIGQTGHKTRNKIKKAKGGVLFVDEAYRLVPMDRSYNDDYGIEALEEIMSFMDNGKVSVIFAGYKEPMKLVISSNEGLRRRISNIFHFDDFTCEELARILHLKLPNEDEKSPFYGFKLDSRSTSVEEVAALIKRGTTAELREKMNGGLVDQMLVKARENLDSRMDVECTDKYAIIAIAKEDLAAGLRLLSVEEQMEEMAKQEKKKLASTDAKAMMNAIDDELSKIVGLDALKIQLRKWLKGMLLDERRRDIRGIVGERRLPQLAFLGNPGTGKTMVARVLGKLLHMVGILVKDKVIEVQRTDLVGRYVGETGPKTRKRIKEAEGGILFVDEAYRLVPAETSSEDFGLEALEEIMSIMDKGKIVVIFAGYTEPMKHVISSNEGMHRRISNLFHFDDFTCEELAKILHLKLSSEDEKSPFYGFKLDSRSTSVEEVAALIERGTTAELREKMNGGLVDQMLVKARENLDSRMDVDWIDENAIFAISQEDLDAGLRLLRVEDQMEEMVEQEKKKVASTGAKAMMNAVDTELWKIVGLNALKIQLRTWLKGMLLDERRRAIRGIVGARRLPQLAFLGNPGTGKTMVARVLGKLLHMVGILLKDTVIEVQRTDLVAQYIGQTGPKTRKKIKEAEGGILFVDEAYRLVPAETSSEDFGLEALEEIMSIMDKGNIVVIFAGYTEPMNHVISSNEGMRRRISNMFHFDDFSCKQLAKILHLKLHSKDEKSPFYGFELNPRRTSVKDVAALIERGTSAELRSKMNGGLVDQMLVKARENLDSRTDVECKDEHSIFAITRKDLDVGLRLLRIEEKGETHQKMAEELLAKKEALRRKSKRGWRKKPRRRN